MQFTAFERNVLDWYLAKCPDEGLRTQIRAAVVSRRDRTRVGFFLDLSVPAEARLVGSNVSSHLDGPFVESPALEHGGGAILVSQDGRLLFLEVFAYGDHFPEQLTDYRLLDGPEPT